MDQLETMRTSVGVVDAGSFSAVARASGVGQPAVGTRSAALEATLEHLRATFASLR